MQQDKVKSKKKKQKQFIQPIYQNMNAFKNEQKRYKKYSGKQDDFSTLITFENDQQQSYLPLQIQEYKIYKFLKPEGFYVIKNFIKQQEQIGIAKECLFNYAKNYRTNVEQKIQIKEEWEFTSKIRWANLGYSYDWTNRKYPEQKSYIPPLINNISKKAINAFKDFIPQKYTPQSVIINYYGKSNYMTGHLDDAEFDQSSPILSFSFGLPCVFLIGTQSKDDQPNAILLEGGDLAIMGKDSRKSWHGVPRIIQDQIQYKIKGNTQEQKYTIKYLQNNRININIRQVYE